ncbi:hypothetical protein DPSP01_000038 [Paraphaeosphaeria sporulosa]
MLLFTNEAVVLPHLGGPIATPCSDGHGSAWHEDLWKRPVRHHMANPRGFATTSRITYLLARARRNMQNPACHPAYAVIAKLVYTHYAGIPVEPRLSIVTLDHAFPAD